jgi:enoyl-CoA hydratase
MSASDVLLEIDGRVAVVTLNRPAARNALNRSLSAGLRVTMAAAEANSDVDVIVLTGADPAFCAGVDLKELATGNGLIREPRDTGRSSGERRDGANPKGLSPSSGAAQLPGQEVHHGESSSEPGRPWAPTTKPVIGAINGVAVTGGFEVALQCDFLIASERAAFGDTHTRVGVMPGWGLSVLLPQAIGVRRSIEMSLTGNFMGAEEALRFGLVNRVVPHDELLPIARSIAADICGNQQAGVRTLLASYRAIHGMNVADGLRHEARVSLEFLSTFSTAKVGEHREAIAARGRTQV